MEESQLFGHLELLGEVEEQTDLLSGHITYSMTSKNLIKEMLNINEKKRPTAKELLLDYQFWFTI